jgi:ADP-heptose:LPS heptosyltransferase
VALKDSLAAKYHDGSKKTVGLTWRSERAGELLSDKTCDICDVPHWAEFFERLKNKVRFVSLQYGETEDDIAFARWKYGVEIYQDKCIDNFNDVDAAAAQIAALDYVVSISTTAAHLAGALGVPGWVLLPKKPFGHWRAGETICPWYPTLRPVR